MISDCKRISTQDRVRSSCSLSVILSTQSVERPEYLLPQNIMCLIPMQVSSEIIVLHYNQSGREDLRSGGEVEAVSMADNDINGKNINLARISRDDKIINVWMRDKFTCAIMKGVELSYGQFILVVDGDYPYPDDVISRLISELINSPKSIIIASKYGKGYSPQRLPFIRTAISKCARIVVRHGLNIQYIHDPLSGCFAISRNTLGEIGIEGKGDELLLEILVKSNRRGKYDRVAVKEILFGQNGKQFTKKLNFNRMVSYSKAVWHLYRYGSKSERLEDESDIAEQKKHKSVLFLSKAGRFFTVGASGFAVNYLVSFILANVVSNIWYIQATFFGIIISITTNFLLNKVWTFEDKDFSPRYFFRQYLSFMALCALGAVIQLSLVFIFVEYSHVQYGISLIMAVCVASLGNFLLNKKITFREKIWG